MPAYEDAFTVPARRTGGELRADASVIEAVDVAGTEIDERVGVQEPARAVEVPGPADDHPAVVETIEWRVDGASTPSSEVRIAPRRVLRAYGLERRAHAAFCSDGEMWVAWCAYREDTSHPFDERELRFMRAVAPHAGYGLRYAAMLKAALASGPAAGDSVPGVVVLDARDRITLVSVPATSQLRDLASVGIAADSMSYAVASVLIRIRTAHATGDGALRADLRAQGRSGRWYTLHGSLAEPDSSGDSAAVIVIEPVGPREPVTSFSLRYGLSPREREVLLMVIRGESTKRIANRMGISAYTVQDHLDNACEKVGVRGRKALLARILADRTAPGS